MKKLIFSLFIKIIKSLSAKGIGKIPGILRLYNLIYKILYPKGIILIDIQGSKMYVNTQDKGLVPSLLVYGVYEKYESELFKKLIKPGMLVVDIGANIGYYSLIAAKLVGNNGRVYAFEPEPNNYNLLVKNIKINNLANIIPIQKAVSNKRGNIKLFLDKVNLAAHSFSENNIPIQKEGFVEVEALTLDEFFENTTKNSKVDFIKLDTQGAEGLVVEGSTGILSSNNLKIVMEFWPYGLKNMGTDPLRLLHKLQNFGFRIKLIDEVSQCMKDIEIMEIVRRYGDAKNTDYINLFLEK
jgi:FkbM family methyltransferase